MTASSNRKAREEEEMYPFQTKENVIFYYRDMGPKLQYVKLRRSVTLWDMEIRNAVATQVYILTLQ